MPEKRKTINLPALPKSWNHLSTRELEQVNLLMRRKQQQMNTTDPDIADRHFKLKCFLLLTGLKFIKRTAMDDKDEVIYLLRRRGIKHCMEKIPMRSWQVNQWIDSCLSFLDNPQKRTVAPYTTIRLYGKKFKGPAGLMTNLTYHQYSRAQMQLSSYWETLKLIETLIDKNASGSAIKAQMKNLKMYQCRFLSTLFNESYIEKQIQKEGKVIKVNRRVWVYDELQTEKNEWRFKKVSAKMFPVMLQFFQSVQTHFSFIFPDLFTEGESTPKTNILHMEAHTVNALMKYQGFKDTETVYQTDSFRILEILDTMSKDAKQIEEMNRKMKSKK